MTTIVEFLTARYDEIEAAARAAVDATPGTIARAADQWAYQHEGFAGDDYWTISTESAEIVTGGYEGGGTVSEEAAVHIALHDPAYVLADITAKRAILDSYTTTARLRDDAADRIRAAGDNPSATDLNQWTRAHMEAHILRELAVLPLALPFSSHPEYDERWRP